MFLEQESKAASELSQTKMRIWAGKEAWGWGGREGVPDKEDSLSKWPREEASPTELTTEGNRQEETPTLCAVGLPKGAQMVRTAQS